MSSVVAAAAIIAPATSHPKPGTAAEKFKRSRRRNRKSVVAAEAPAAATSAAAASVSAAASFNNSAEIAASVAQPSRSTARQWACAVCARTMHAATMQAHLTGSDHKRKLATATASCIKPPVQQTSAVASKSTRVAQAAPAVAASDDAPSMTLPAAAAYSNGAKLWTCTTCAHTMQTGNMQSHLNGAQHKLNVNATNASTPTATHHQHNTSLRAPPHAVASAAAAAPSASNVVRNGGVSVLRCNPCREDFQSREALSHQTVSKLHKKRAKEQQKRDEAARKLNELMPALTLRDINSASMAAAATSSSADSPADSDSVNECAFCFNAAPAFRCVACPDVSYCCVKCQRKDWPSHARDCRGIEHTPADSEEERQADARGIYAEWYGADMGNSAYEGGD